MSMSLRLLRPAALVALFALAGSALPARRPDDLPARYIVRAASAETAAAATERAGGRVLRPLPVVRGVLASADARALRYLAAARGVAVQADAAVHASQGPGPAGEGDTAGALLYPAAASGVSALHTQSSPAPRTQSCDGQGAQALPKPEDRPLQGWGVTVAVIDSGFMQFDNAKDWSGPDAQTGALFATNNEGRCIVYRDFLPRADSNGNAGANELNSTDQNGHGTHVIATIADNRTVKLKPAGGFEAVGVAPKVNLLLARALDRDGAGSYSDVISAIDWVIQNRARFNVRVLNLSLYTPVAGPYWADPLNVAVMEAWRAGIVVVAAAGNAGPDPATITVPGNNPYVITAGAIKSGRYTVSGLDELAFYSSRGPTESAFVKPDVLVPASRTIAPVPSASTLALALPEARIYERARVDFGIGKSPKQHGYYQLSGTSMAAAEVSGIVALMLQAAPSLSNDQVKERLLATALPALDAQGQPVYSVWEQGAGRVAAAGAVFSNDTAAANAGLAIAADLDSGTHFWGHTAWDAQRGQFCLVEQPNAQQPPDACAGATHVWAGVGHVWAGVGHVWAGVGHVWAGVGHVWAGVGHVWAGSWEGDWKGETSLWAGVGHVWAGKAPVTRDANTASLRAAAESLVEDPAAYRVYVAAGREVRRGCN